jgi:hypothetical protein
MTVCVAVFEPLEAHVATRGSSFGRGTSSHAVLPTPYSLLPYSLTPYFAVIPATSARNAAMVSAMKRLSSASTVPA